MVAGKVFPAQRRSVPLVDMAANRQRRREKGSHCARRTLASTLDSLGEDRIRDATNFGCSVGVRRGIARPRRRTLLGALALVLVSACSSGDAAPSTTPSSSNGGVESTSSTTAATTTSTSPSTTTTSSTELPTTTIVDPRASAESNVRAALDLAQSSFSDCLTAMPACDPSTLAVARAGDLLKRNVSRIEEWNAAGYTVIDRDQFRYVIESVTIGDDRTTATVVVCIADGSKLVLPGAAPDGGNVIVDDAYTSGRSQWEMRLDGDGRWRGYDAPAVGPTESTDQCSA